MLETGLIYLADAEYLCRVDFNVTDLGMAAFDVMRGPRKGCLQPREKFYRAHFEVKMIMGATDVRFEAWNKGVKYGDNHVTIDWGT